jgi:hypothetical protein
MKEFRKRRIATYLIIFISIIMLTIQGVLSATPCFQTKFPRLYGGNLANTTLSAISMISSDEVSIHFR